MLGDESLRRNFGNCSILSATELLNQAGAVIYKPEKGNRNHIPIDYKPKRENANGRSGIFYR